jgi:hypothetical protein
LIDGSCYRRLVRHIATDRERFGPAIIADLIGSFFCSIVVKVGDDNVRALDRKTFGSSAADAAGTAGYDRDLVIESHIASWPAMAQGRDSSPDFSQPGSRISRR